MRGNHGQIEKHSQKRRRGNVVLIAARENDKIRAEPGLASRSRLYGFERAVVTW